LRGLRDHDPRADAAFGSKKTRGPPELLGRPQPLPSF